jgi:hypothetical protein
MLRTIFLAAILASITVLSAAPASAGCVGAAIGDGCIGIPTPAPESGHPYQYDDHDRDQSTDKTIIIKKHPHHHHDDDQDNY